MHDPLLREIPEVGSSVIWFFKFCMIIAGVFIMFIAVAMWAVLRARSSDQQAIRYLIFRDLLNFLRDLLDLFRPRRGR